MTATASNKYDDGDGEDALVLCYELLMPSAGVLCALASYAEYERHRSEFLCSSTPLCTDCAVAVSTAAPVPPRKTKPCTSLYYCNCPPALFCTASIVFHRRMSVFLSVCVSVPTRKNVKTSRPRRYVVEMYSSAATVALTPIVGFNFVIRSTFVMSYTYKAVSGYLLRVFTVVSQDYSCTSDLQNLK